MPRICRPINPMEGRDYLTLDDRVRTLSGPSRDAFRMSAIAVLRSCCHQRTRDDPVSAQRNPPLRGSVLLPDVVHIPALIANAAELDRMHGAEVRQVAGVWHPPTR